MTNSSFDASTTSDAPTIPGRPWVRSNATSTSPSVQRYRHRKRRAGFTLLEVLIATAVTLLMMLSLSQIFKVIGESMQRGRAVLELNNRLRSVTHRIRTDLRNMTAIPRPPADPGAAQGYFKYFDGSQTDFSTLALPTVPVPPTSATNRIGDIDDILMGTVKAGDTWFTGKVPLFVLEGRMPISQSDMENQVTIASQYAEVVMFVQPLVASSKQGFPYNNPDRNPAYLVVNPNFFQGNLVPDAYRLHYRTLLIRPDLNLPEGVLPGNRNLRLLTAQPTPAEIDGFSVDLPTPLCDMARVHTDCDLSVRRVFDPTNAVHFVAANSLADLASPANRFAHAQVRIPRTNSTTMPLLALGPPLPLHSATDPDGRFGQSSGGGSIDDPLAGFVAGSGFLHPAFCLQRDRMGEDILATDILAFDVKIFDPSVPILPHLGAEQVPGAPLPPNFGEAGSDDQALSPNDPGYHQVLNATPVGTGDYVDLCWGRKTQLAAGAISFPPHPVLFGQFSGYSPPRAATPPVIGQGYTESLYKSGCIITVENNPGRVHLLQPCYDTWSTHFEGDGILQTHRVMRDGVVRINGYSSLYLTAGPTPNDFSAARHAWRQNAIDAGTDGIDNALSAPGVDDSSEMETSAPFPVPLRGIKVTVRMEDPGTRQMHQMSVVEEFVTN